MKLEFSFLLGILTTLLGVYYKLFQKIIEITTQEPWSFIPMFYSVIHFIVLFMIFKVLKLLYYKSNIIEKNESARDSEINKIEKFLTTAWIPLTLYCLMLIFASEIIGSIQNPAMPSFLTIGILLLVFTILFKNLSIMSTDFIRSLVFVPILCIIHTFILSQFSSNVVIKTNKEFYLNNETIQLSLKPTGYIFLPNIKHVLYGFNDTLNIDSQGNAIVDSTILKKNLVPRLQVVFEPQIVKLLLYKYVDINVANLK